MNADEARALTNESLKGAAIDKYVQYIDELIKIAALNGVSEIRNPQRGSIERGRGYHVFGDELKAVRQYYKSKGFVWTDYPAPDPGHPCSSPYTILSW